MSWILIGPLISIFFVLPAYSLTPDEAQKVISETLRSVKPLIRQAHPGTSGEIPVRLSWNDDYPSASSGDDGISLTGGLLRLPYLTADALALILCHEVGHDAAVTRQQVGADKVFAGEEIMADYFGGVCLPFVLRASPMLSQFPSGVGEVVGFFETV